MKQIEVQILQQSYMLTCPEGQQERVMEAVRRVDEAMTGIRDSGKVRSRERVAVLAALNMAFDVLDRDAQQTSQQTHMNGAATETQAAPQTEQLNQEQQAEQQRQLELAEQLVLKLDKALEDDARLL